MVMTRYFIIVGLAMLLAIGCIDPYNPPEIESSANFLVVDGLVDVGAGNARVVLAHSQALDEQSEPLLETGAQVTIEVTNGPMFSLSETFPGEYTAGNLPINPGDQCQLRIRTASGKEFLSETVTSIDTPAIDSITWTARPGQLDIEVNTHDPGGNTRYYRWKYVETAMYQSPHLSSYIWDTEENTVRPRTNEERIFTCWKTTPSTNINVFSTNGLAEDIVSRHIVQSLPSNSWKLRLKYSILVYQYAIGQEEFNFWTELRKNTENIGTIFDPQPSQVTGNIRSVNAPGEKVLGYFSAGSISEERIFISRDDLPYSGFDTGYPSCNYLDVDTLYMEEYLNSSKRALLISAVTSGPSVIGYTTADDYCIDCRIAHQGTNERPDFWE
jgi:hypothetical protein